MTTTMSFRPRIHQRRSRGHRSHPPWVARTNPPSRPQPSLFSSIDNALWTLLSSFITLTPKYTQALMPFISHGSHCTHERPNHIISNSQLETTTASMQSSYPAEGKCLWYVGPTWSLCCLDNFIDGRIAGQLLWLLHPGESFEKTLSRCIMRLRV